MLKESRKEYKKGKKKKQENPTIQAKGKTQQITFVSKRGYNREEKGFHKQAFGRQTNKK